MTIVNSMSLWNEEAMLELQTLYRFSAVLSVCRIKTLSDTHLIRSLLKGPERKKAKPHALSLLKLGNPEGMNCMLSAVTEVQQIIGGLMEAFEPYADQAHLGARVIDLYSEQIIFLDWKAEDSL